jgi:hypothetical protein
VVQRPAQDGGGVVGGGRERVLGREPVGHRQHVHARLAAQQPAGLVVALEVADDVAAAVEEDEQRRGPVGLGQRRVQARGQRAGRAADLQVAHVADRDRLAGEGDGLARARARAAGGGSVSSGGSPRRSMRPG